MSSFHNIKLEWPCYPVYKAYFVPYREGDKLYDVRRVTKEDVEVWRHVLSKLREFLSKALRFARSEQGLSNAERIELVCDLIALFFRIPLIRELLPSLAPNPIKVYMLYRLTGGDIGEMTNDPFDFIQTFYDSVVMASFCRTDMAKTLDDYTLSERVERCWFVFPADTRPIFNTSGLIPHLLLTSALAWALAIEKGFDRYRAAMIRLAAMLHDMGKPFNYAAHVRASVRVAKALLEGLLPEAEEIKEFVRTHHVASGTPEGRILGESDSYSTSLDRLGELAKRELLPRLSELAKPLGLNVEDAYAIGSKAWEFWCRLAHAYGDRVIEELSASFVKRMREATEGFTKPVELPGGEPIEGVNLALIDIGGIQPFVRKAVELKCVVAASLTIDVLAMGQLPALLQREIQKASRNKVWMPYEAMLYTAGGVVEFLLPDRLIDEASDIIRKVDARLRRMGLALRLASVRFNTDYAATISNLANRIHAEKFKVDLAGTAVRLASSEGARELCEFCYSASPDPDCKVPTVEGDVRACRICSNLYSIGEDLHFMRRYESGVVIEPSLPRYRPSAIFRMPWKEEGVVISASDYIVEIIAGHDKNELERLGTNDIKRRNLAVLNADGNLIGPLMATCFSPTDAYERSARLDLALKKALEVAVSALRRGVLAASGIEEEGAKAALAVKLGIVYAGGDDCAILLPSWATPLFISVLGREFVLNMGKARGLSIGVAAGPCKASVWSLIDAANALMKEAKKKGREDPATSVVCFDLVETGALSKTSAIARFKSLKAKLLTAQPLPIGSTNEDSFEALLSLLIGHFTDPEDIAERSYVLSRFARLSGKLEDKVRNEQRRLKRARSAIRSVISAAKSMLPEPISEWGKDLQGWALSLSYLYGVRQIRRATERRGREAEETRKSYEVCAKLSPAKVGETARYADADRLAKMLGGGAL